LIEENNTTTETRDDQDGKGQEVFIKLSVTKGRHAKGGNDGSGVPAREYHRSCERCITIQRGYSKGPLLLGGGLVLYGIHEAPTLEEKGAEIGDLFWILERNQKGGNGGKKGGG